MNTILFKKIDNSLIISNTTSDVENLQEYADKLISDNIIKGELIGFNIDFPDNGWNVDVHVYDDKTNAIVVDLEKAREYTNKRLRLERTPLLSKLDIEFQRALETGSDTSMIVKEKQRLRDVTLLVNEITDLDNLKLINCD